jgi:hypothetical protein
MPLLLLLAKLTIASHPRMPPSNNVSPHNYTSLLESTNLFTPPSFYSTILSLIPMRFRLHLRYALTNNLFTCAWTWACVIPIAIANRTYNTNNAQQQRSQTHRNLEGNGENDRVGNLYIHRWTAWIPSVVLLSLGRQYLAIAQQPFDLMHPHRPLIVRSSSLHPPIVPSTSGYRPGIVWVSFTQTDKHV